MWSLLFLTFFTTSALSLSSSMTEGLIILSKTSVEKSLTSSDFSMTGYSMSPPVFSKDAKIIINDVVTEFATTEYLTTYQRYSNHNSTFLVENGEIKSFLYFTSDSFVEIINDNNHSIKNEYKYNTSGGMFNGSNDFSPTEFSPAIKNQDGVYEFFPDCYPGDDKINVFKMGVAVDYGVYLNLGSDNNKVISEIEQIVATVRLLYTRQTHVRIDIGELYIGNKNSHPPLNRNAQDGSCKGAMGAFNEMSEWIDNTSTKSNYWMEVSDCFSGTVGVSWISALCSSWANYGVSARNWLIFAHELGHGFGCTHSFENGIGLTGGIMDYGTGLYEGVYQFHPGKKSEFCGFVNILKNDQRYASCITIADNTCGDGVMGLNEQCECIKKGSKKCGICVNCKLTKRIQCAVTNPNTFIMRYPSSKEYVSVYDKSIYTHKNCCVKNKFKGPKTLCGTMGACGLNGICNNACRYFNIDSKPCGFDTQGCKLGCTYLGRCYKLDLPDMTPCTLGPRNNSVCINSVCKYP